MRRPLASRLAATSASALVHGGATEIGDNRAVTRPSIEHQRGILGACAPAVRAPDPDPRPAASDSLASAPASAGCRRCRRTPPASGSSSRSRCPAPIGSMPVATATAEPPDEPAGLKRRIPRIAGRAEYVVESVGAGGEFRRVGLRQHDGAGGFQPPHRFGVFIRNVVLEQRRPEGGADAGGRRDVLDAERQAVQRTQGLASHHGASAASIAAARA